MTGFEVAGIYRVKRKLSVAKIYPKSQQLFRVIPAKAGIQNVKSKETVLSDKFPRRQNWIPACAGMTVQRSVGRDVGWASARHSRPTANFSASFPRKRESGSVEFQPFLINSCSFEFLDSHFRGNDGIRVFVWTYPSFPRRRESRTRPHGNLYFVITPIPPCPTPPKKNQKKPNLTKSDKKRQPETDKNCHN